MFKKRNNCSKCIDIYEKGLRNETRFKESLKKLTSKEKSFINNRIRDRRKFIHKQFTNIFRDEADTMLSVIENVANKKKMNKMAEQVQLRKGQQLMNQWEKTRLLQKKTRRNNAAKKIQTMFKKARKSRKNRSPKMSTKLDRYQRNMLDVLGADNENYSDPEDKAFENEFFDVPLDDSPIQLVPLPRFSDRRLTATQKMEAVERNLKTHKAYMDKKKSNSHRSTKRLSESAREAGIKKVKDGYLITPKTQYRYSAPGNNTSGDFESKPEKKGFFENLFGSSNKGGRRRRKRRKRKRTRKKRKRRRRKTRK